MVLQNAFAKQELLIWTLSNLQANKLRNRNTDHRISSLSNTQNYWPLETFSKHNQDPMGIESFNSCTQLNISTVSVWGALLLSYTILEEDINIFSHLTIWLTSGTLWESVRSTLFQGHDPAHLPIHGGAECLEKHQEIGARPFHTSMELVILINNSSLEHSRPQTGSTQPECHLH